jgi:hypothetical protein
MAGTLGVHYDDGGCPRIIGGILARCVQMRNASGCG